MKTHTPLLVALLSLLLSPLTARGEERALRSLYSKRFTMDAKGVPLVKIGLERGRSMVTFHAPGGLVVTHGKEALQVRGSTTFKVTVAKGRPARLRYWVSLKSVNSTNRAERERARQELKGYRYTPVEQGFVIALGGKVLDTRRVLYSLGPYSSYTTAKKRQLRLAKKRTGVFVHSQLVALPQGRLTATSSSGLTLTGTAVLTFRGVGGKPLLLSSGGVQRSYPGLLHAVVGTRGKITVVNEIPLERYLQGILPSELFPSAPLEALKAQAVAARGQVLAKMGARHHGDPFHLCARVHCQVYEGLHKVYPRTSRAVALTKGLVLFDRAGLPADTVYHSSSGGHTEHNELVWGGEPKSYLRGRPDGVRWSYTTEGALLQFLRGGQGAYCKAGNSRFRWERTLSRAQLNRILRRNGMGGTFRGVRVLKRGISGRAIALQVSTSREKRTLNGELVIRRFFGGLRSSMFVVQKTKGGLRFKGGGYGHGVGMSQWGAINRAKVGHSFDTILRWYYKGTRLKKIY